MKILILATNTLFNTGVVNVIKNYCLNIDRSSIDFRFCFSCIRDPQLKEWFERNLGSVTCVGNRNRRLLSYCIKLRRYIKENGFDIVHVHCNSHLALPELVAARWAGCKVVMVHSHQTTCSNPFLHRLLSWPFDALYTHALACGKEAGVWMFGSKPFEVINNGVDTEHFAFNLRVRNNLREMLKYKETDFVLAHIGMFNEQKNHKFLVQVFDKLHQHDNKYKLLLIGEGKLLGDVKQQVKNLGLQNDVYFTGGTNEVSKYLCAADEIVMPSLYEGLPLALIEEQANGLPCVVADTITREADKTGNLTYVSLDAGIETWVKAIEQMPMGDRGERSGKAIKDITVAGYSIRKEANKLLSIYEKAYERTIQA